jgi:hypothetical protein
MTWCFDQQNPPTFLLQPELRIHNTPVDASTFRPMPVVKSAPVTSTRPYAVAATGPVATTSTDGEDENRPDINAHSNNNPDSLKVYNEIFNKVIF